MWKLLILSNLIAILHGSPAGILDDGSTATYDGKSANYLQYLGTKDNKPLYRALSSPPLIPAPAPYGSLYPAQAQYAQRQQPYPYYPAPYYPNPYQFYYPPQLQSEYGAPPPGYVYLTRYPAEGSTEQGSTPQNPWAGYWPASFGGNNPFSGWFGSSPSWPSNPFAGSPPAAGASPADAAGSAEAVSPPKNKPEKLEGTETPTQDSGKSEQPEKDAETVQQPQVQPHYALVSGYPQYFGQFAAFPADRDPTALQAATKGAISSFLIYRDQAQALQSPQLYQQQQPWQQQQAWQQPQAQVQKSVENQNAGSAQVAYQRFLLLSKQRAEEGGIKSAAQQKSEINATSKETIKSNNSATINSESLQSKPSDGLGSIAQVMPSAVAYAGVGGLAGAAPIGKAIAGEGGIASSAPRAIAFAGVSDEISLTITPAHRMRSKIFKNLQH